MKRIMFLVLCVLWAVTMTAGAKADDKSEGVWTTIQNGKVWLTAEGDTVQAHAPGFVLKDGVWYMCGEDRGNSWRPDVNLYSSRNLVHWKFEKKIIENGVTTKELGRSRMIERPKLLYNPKTGKYVVWCHYESRNYGASEAACFESDRVDGEYRYVWSGRPLGVKSRDCNVFQDWDGTAYFISTTEENQHLGLFRLSEDYHEAVEHTELFSHQRREAPAIVRLGDRYFMFSSACTGWDPNQCKLSYSNDLRQGWTPLENIGNDIAFDTQAAAILEVRGTKRTTYLYVGDRWQDPGLPDTKTIIFPVEFEGERCRFEYHERFDINFTTGEWRETPTDGLFADRSGWKVVDCSGSAEGRGGGRNVFDGNKTTAWFSRQGDEGEALHFVEIDMGRMQKIRGMLITPNLQAGGRGLVRDYEFLVSSDGKDWTVASGGRWMPYCTEVDFEPQVCRYFKLVCRGSRFVSVAEIDVIAFDN